MGERARAVTVGIEDPAKDDVAALLRRGEAHSASLYPAESNHHMPLEELRSPHVLFLVARDEAGTALATGALVKQEGWAEIKRMWVSEEARGRGLSRLILERLQHLAAEAGIAVLRLETGVDSHAALSLYARAGFQTRGPFADYRPDPLSVFMEKAS